MMKCIINSAMAQYSLCIAIKCCTMLVSMHNVIVYPRFKRFKERFRRRVVQDLKECLTLTGPTSSESTSPVASATRSKATKQ